MKIVITAILFLVCLTGCGRMTACRHGNEYGLYPGVRYACRVIGSGYPVFRAMASISLPFDFVADTVMLPRDMIRDMIISNELVVMEYKLAPDNDEVWEFMVTDEDRPDEIIELNRAKARNKKHQIVITKKRQYVIENWFSDPENSVSVERGYDKVIKFTRKE